MINFKKVVSMVVMLSLMLGACGKSPARRDAGAPEDGKTATEYNKSECSLMLLAAESESVCQCHAERTCPTGKDRELSGKNKHKSRVGCYIAGAMGGAVAVIAGVLVVAKMGGLPVSTLGKIMTIGSAGLGGIVLGAMGGAYYGEKSERGGDELGLTTVKAGGAGFVVGCVVGALLWGMSNWYKKAVEQNAIEQKAVEQDATEQQNEEEPNKIDGDGDGDGEGAAADNGASVAGDDRTSATGEGDRASVAGDDGASAAGGGVDTRAAGRGGEEGEKVDGCQPNEEKRDDGKTAEEVRRDRMDRMERERRERIGEEVGEVGSGGEGGPKTIAPAVTGGGTATAATEATRLILASNPHQMPTPPRGATTLTLTKKMIRFLQRPIGIGEIVGTLGLGALTGGIVGGILEARGNGLGVMMATEFSAGLVAGVCAELIGAFALSIL